MRALLTLIALVIIVVIILVYTGVISLTQTRQGQAPEFNVAVKSIELGTKPENVQVPTVGTRTKQIDVPTVRVGNSSDGNHQ